MANALSCKPGIQLARRDSELLLQLITVEPWVSCWFGMLLIKHLSIILGIGFAILNSMLSDNVNKILVGNKVDMDESKRAVPTSKGQALADEYVSYGGLTWGILLFIAMSWIARVATDFSFIQ